MKPSQLPRSRLRLTALQLTRQEVRIGEQCAGAELGQNIEGRERCRVVHQRQIDKLLDCPTPKL